MPVRHAADAVRAVPTLLSHADTIRMPAEPGGRPRTDRRFTLPHSVRASIGAEGIFRAADG